MFETHFEAVRGSSTRNGDLALPRRGCHAITGNLRGDDSRRAGLDDAPRKLVAGLRSDRHYFPREPFARRCLAGISRSTSRMRSPPTPTASHFPRPKPTPASTGSRNGGRGGGTLGQRLLSLDSGRSSSVGSSPAKRSSLGRNRLFSIQ